MSSPLNVLLLYPRFPQTFWSFDRFMELADLKATIPPLGIITVAALLPQEWQIRFVLLRQLELCLIVRIVNHTPAQSEPVNSE